MDWRRRERHRNADNHDIRQHERCDYKHDARPGRKHYWNNIERGELFRVCHVSRIYAGYIHGDAGSLKRWTDIERNGDNRWYGDSIHFDQAVGLVSLSASWLRTSRTARCRLRAEARLFDMPAWKGDQEPWKCADSRRQAMPRVVCWLP